MLDRRFTTLFVSVTALLATAIYVSGQAAKHGGSTLTVVAAVAMIAGIVGFLVLARAVVVRERGRSPR